MAGIPKHVRLLFEKRALDLIARGHKRSSADGILHTVRERYPCNDHWTSQLARWFVTKHPKHAGFFELRALRR